MVRFCRRTIAQRLLSAGKDQTKTSQQTGGIEPMLVSCWSTVCDAGPTLNQHEDVTTPDEDMNKHHEDLAKIRPGELSDN